MGHLAGVVHRGALQAPDVDGIVHHFPAAAGLAGMLADIGAGDREGVVLPDEPHRVGITAFPHQGHVAGDVHSGGAHGHAGHRVVQGAQAAVMPNMLFKVFPETADAGEHQLGRVDADRAVGCADDDLCRLLDAVDDALVRLPVQHLLQHVGQLAEADAAGGAFAAGLGAAEVQTVQGFIHGAYAGRTARDSPLHVPVDGLHHRLHLARRSYFQSAQGMSHLPFLGY